MIVKIDRSFEKDTDKINDKFLLNKIASCIESVAKVSPSASNIQHPISSVFFSSL